MLKKCIVVVALGLATVANASNWVDLGDDGKKRVLVDADSIKYANQAKKQREAWVKYIMLDNSEYKKGDYVLSNPTFDCAANKTLFGQVVHYSKAGVMQSETSNVKKGWSAIPPDSLFEYISKVVCTYPKI